jgi:hypothetical protein
VILTYNKTFATIEFETTQSTAEVYSGAFQRSDHIPDVVKEILPESGLKALSDDFKEMKTQLTKKVDRFYTQFLTIITIVIAILGLLIGKLLLGL